MEFRTLADAESYLDGFINRERVASFDYERLGLERIRMLLAGIGNPEVSPPCIHIAGSKGKGSTALACEALLAAAGLRVGTYTSPHLESWRERFRIDRAPVGVDRLLRGLRGLAPAAERLRRDPAARPSFFDVTTALALAIFREAGADAAAIEVGIGGRIDSTNVVESRVSVLTTVQLEHTDKLGSTLEEIAGEKAGILRPGVPMLHGPLELEALSAVVARAVAEDAPLEEVRPRVLREGAEGLELELPDGRRAFASTIGAHQATNLALALRAVETFLSRALRPEEIAALGSLRLPARVERFGSVILDCAHSPDSARALRRALEAVWPERPWVLVVSLAKDKDAPGFFAGLAQSVRACVVTRAEPLRSTDPDALEPLARAAGIAQVEAIPEPKAALDRARELAGEGNLVVITGSLYLAGALRPLLCAAPEGRNG